MSELSDYETRINAALERIAEGVMGLDRAGATGANAEEVAALQSALEAEKNANAQLEERVRAIGAKQENQVAQLEARVAKLTARNEASETELNRIKSLNAQLRDNNQALRAANAEGLGDAELINQAIQTELDSVSALRSADRAELDEIIEELIPLTKESQDA